MSNENELEAVRQFAEDVESSIGVALRHAGLVLHSASWFMYGPLLEYKSQRMEVRIGFDGRDGQIGFLFSPLSSGPDGTCDFYLEHWLQYRRDALVRDGAPDLRPKGSLRRRDFRREWMARVADALANDAQAVLRGEISELSRIRAFMVSTGHLEERA